MNTFSVPDTVALTSLIFKTTLWSRLFLSFDGQDNWGMVNLAPRVTQLGRADIWALHSGFRNCLTAFDCILILNEYISETLFQVSRESWNGMFVHLHLDYLWKKVSIMYCILNTEVKLSQNFLLPLMIDIRTSECIWIIR